MRTKVLNFRAIRPIVNQDGKQIRDHAIFRSGKLSKISAKKLKLLKEKYGISAVIDLRAPAELDDCPDRKVDEVSFFHYPPLTDEQNPAVNSKTRVAILKNIMSKEGGAIQHLSDTYREMISSDLSRESFHDSIMTLLRPEHDSVLFHCTQGKDRTGVFAMVVLMALGVHRDEIYKDYMLSNRYCRIRNYLIFLGVSVGTLSIKRARALHQLLTARKEYFDSVFNEIDECFGSIDSYLHDGLGLTDSDLLRLQEKYLCVE